MSETKSWRTLHKNKLLFIICRQLDLENKTGNKQLAEEAFPRIEKLAVDIVVGWLLIYRAYHFPLCIQIILSGSKPSMQNGLCALFTVVEFK